MAKCAVCGAAHASCGPPTTVVPVDERVALRKEGAVGALKRYEVDVPYKNGTHRTTLLLSDEDARAQGLIPEKAAQKAPPSNQAVTPANTAAQPQETKKKRQRFLR